MAAKPQKDIRHFDTIVIGAGISGLSCAARLFQHPNYMKPNSLLVLEARNRIGGRIGSVHVNGNRLDTGANWIHGIGTKEHPNPLMKVLPHKRYKQLSKVAAFRAPASSKANSQAREENASDEDWVQVQDSKRESEASVKAGDLVIPADIAGPLTGAMWGMVESLHDMATEMPFAEAKRTTMLQAITRSDVFRGAFEDIPEEYHHTFRAMPQWIEHMEAAPLAAQSAEHARDHAGMSLLEFAIDDFDGDQVFLQDGYTAVVDEVAKELTAAGILELGVEVQQIAWATDPIVVTTSSGTFTAKRIVCTLPLGVLQHHCIDKPTKPQTLPLFKPSLPSAHSEAISSLGFGTLDKIFLVYNHAWWTSAPYLNIFKKGIVRRRYANNDLDEDTTPELDSFIGFTPELPGIEIHPDGTTTSGICVISIINLHSLTGFPVLSCFVSCSNAAHIESLSDADAGAIIHRSLSTWLGREPPKPEAVHVTRWAKDEYSRGSYSHMITGLSETKHREVLREPVGNKKGAELRFAGEHTSRDHFATVHGALLSGWREADAILEARSKE